MVIDEKCVVVMYSNSYLCTLFLDGHRPVVYVRML